MLHVLVIGPALVIALVMVFVKSVPEIGSKSPQQWLEESVDFYH